MFSPEKKPVIKEQKSTIKKIEMADVKQIPKKWEQLGAGPLNLIINSVSEDKNAAHLAQSCRFLFHTTKPALDERKLAHHVIVHPSELNKVNVIARLTVEPMLVSHKIKQSKDIVGRIIKNKTLFQLAYGAGDDDFCLAMKPAFIKHLGSESAAIEEMERQRNEMLESEEDYKNQEEKSKAHFDALLQPVIKAIDAEQFNLGRDINKKLILSPATLAAINTFREEFAKSQSMVINNGMHFRYETLQETLNAYVRAAGHWEYNYNKCALFEDSVVATVLSYAPVNDAMQFSQGLYYLQDEVKPEPRKRSLALRRGGSNFYGVCRKASADFALCCSGVDILFGGRGLSGEGSAGYVGPALTAHFKFLCQTKTSNLQNLCSQPSHSRALGI
jgi:hypothetical protein